MKVSIKADACGEFCYDLSEANVLKLIGAAQTMAADVSQPADLKKPTSKLERMFGNYRARIPVDAVIPAVKKAVNDDDDRIEGYKGFLLLECESCGKRRGFYVKSKQRVYFCECGHTTKLKNLRPAYVYCSDCRDTFRYMTNITDTSFSHYCLGCEKQIKMVLSDTGDSFVVASKK